MPREKPRFSIIMPVYQESPEAIDRMVRHIRLLGHDHPIEMIVVDGHPEGHTIGGIRSDKIKTVLAPKGRGNQLNMGAQIAGGDVLLFLHADTTLPPRAFDLIGEAMADGHCIGGAFDLHIDSDRPAFRMIEKIASWRSRFTRIPYGDQAIFVDAGIFKIIGAFRNIPIMEDVDLMRRIKKGRHRIVILKEKVATSARRWEKEGVLFCTLRNWVLVGLFLAGVSPERLVRHYRS